MTPFFATVLYPVRVVDPSALRVLVPGPYLHDSGDVSVTERQFNFEDQAQVNALLSPEVRGHLRAEVTVGHLTVDAIEVVALEPSLTEPQHLLVVHLRSKEKNCAEISALTQLGQVVRPRRKESRELVETVLNQSQISTDAIEVLAVPRVPVMSLSEPAPLEENRGLLRWEKRDAVSGRLYDLVVLRKDRADKYPHFSLPISVPTPSHAMASSGNAIAVIRTRAPLSSYHVNRMRTQWLDAFMVELIRGWRVEESVGRLRSMPAIGHGREWRDLERDLIRWRSSRGWTAATDRPMGQAIAQATRRAMGTDDRLDLVMGNLAVHNEIVRDDAAGRLGWAVFVLTLAAAAVPIGLHLARDEVGLWFWITVGAGGLLVLVALGLVAFRRR